MLASAHHQQRRFRYAMPNHVHVYVVQFLFPPTPYFLPRDGYQLKCIATASFGITPCAINMSTKPCSGSISFLGKRS